MIIKEKRTTIKLSDEEKHYLEKAKIIISNLSQFLYNRDGYIVIKPEYMGFTFEDLDSVRDCIEELIKYDGVIEVL